MPASQKHTRYFSMVNLETSDRIAKTALDGSQPMGVTSGMLSCIRHGVEALGRLGFGPIV